MKVLSLFLSILTMVFLSSCSDDSTSSNSSENESTTTAVNALLSGAFITGAYSDINATLIEGVLVPEHNATIRTINLEDNNIKIEVTSRNSNEEVIPIEVSEVNQTIIFKVPLNTVDGTLRIFNGNELLASREYKVYKQNNIYITSITPEVAAPGESISISGSNFAPTMLLLSDDNDFNISVVSVNNEISFILPLHTRSGMFYLRDDLVDSNPLYLSVKRDINVEVSVSQELLRSQDLNKSTISFVINSVEYGIDDTNLTTLPIENTLQYIHASVEVQDGNFSHLYSAVVLPGTSNTVAVDANSTAIAWILMGMGISDNIEDDKWDDIYEMVKDNLKVHEFATYIDTLQKTDFSSWTDLSDETLKVKFQEALLSVIESQQQVVATSTFLADALDDSKALVTIKQDPLNDNIYIDDLRHGYITSDKLNNGSVSIVNDTKLYLSIEARSKETGDIINNYKHIDDIMNMDVKTLVKPSSGGLLSISNAVEIELDGEDAYLEVIAGSYGGTTDKNDISDILKDRAFIDGMATPSLNIILSTLINRTISKSNSFKNCIDGMADIYGSGFLIQLTTQVSNQNNSLDKVLDKLVMTPVKNGIGACFQVPVGSACEKTFVGISKMVGLDPSKAVHTFMLMILDTATKSAMKKGVFVIPVIGWIAGTSFAIYDNYNRLGLVSDLATIGSTIYDMGMNPKEINTDIAFKLKIDDVTPTCMAVSESDTQTNVYVSGERFILDALQTPKLLINTDNLDTVNATLPLDTVTDTKIYASFASGELISSGSVLGSLFVDYDGYSIMYNEKIKIIDESDSQVYFDSIEPDKASKGVTVALKGCGWIPLSDINVHFKSADGDVSAEIISSDVETIYVKVPDDAISGSVYVTAGIKRTKNIYFEVEKFGLTQSNVSSLENKGEIELDGEGLDNSQKVVFIDNTGVKQEVSLAGVILSPNSFFVKVPSELAVGDVSIYVIRDDSKESNALHIPMLPKEVKANPESQGFKESLLVTLSQEDNDDIYYILDDAQEQKYTGPILLTLQDAEYNFYRLKTYARVTRDGIDYNSNVRTYDYTPCGMDDTLVDGECVPSCIKVCSNPTISNVITFPGQSLDINNKNDLSYNISLTFNKVFKWCTQEVDDNNSLNGKVTMLYFYKYDGSGDYTIPSTKYPSYEYTSTFEFGKASVDIVYKDIDMDMSPLPNYNSYTVEYIKPEESFGMSVVNYSDLDSGNWYDYLWFYLRYERAYLDESQYWTIINTEWVETDGCYEGNY